MIRKPNLDTHLPGPSAGHSQEPPGSVWMGPSGLWGCGRPRHWRLGLRSTLGSTVSPLPWEHSSRASAQLQVAEAMLSAHREPRGQEPLQAASGPAPFLLLIGGQTCHSGEVGVCVGRGAVGGGGGTTVKNVNLLITEYIAVHLKCCCHANTLGVYFLNPREAAQPPLPCCVI